MENKKDEKPQTHGVHRNGGAAPRFDFSPMICSTLEKIRRVGDFPPRANEEKRKFTTFAHSFLSSAPRLPSMSSAPRLLVSSTDPFPSAFRVALLKFLDLSLIHPNPNPNPNPFLGLGD